jgi:hypothetical protein
VNGEEKRMQKEVIVTLFRNVSNYPDVLRKFKKKSNRIANLRAENQT